MNQITKPASDTKAIKLNVKNVFFMIRFTLISIFFIFISGCSTSTSTSFSKGAVTNEIGCEAGPVNFEYSKDKKQKSYNINGLVITKNKHD